MNLKVLSRRSFLKSAALSLGVAALAGCTPQVVEKVVKETVVVTQEKVVQQTVQVEKVVTSAPAGPQMITIRYHLRAGDEGLLWPAKVSAFNTANPNIKAVIEPVPGGDVEYVPKIMAMHAAGTIGDAMWTSIGSVNHYQYANMGIIAPLDDLIASANFDSKPYFKGAWESSKYNGKQFGLPLLAHPGAAMLLYNKTMFEKDGAPLPRDDWKLDDMLEAAKHFTRASQQGGRTDSWGFLPFTGRLIVMLVRCFTGYDGDIISPDGKKAMINAPKTKEALSWLYDAYNKHKVCPTPEAQQSGDLFQTSRLAMQQTGCWGGPGLQNAMKAKGDFPIQWWLAALPLGPSGKIGSHAEVDCVCVASKSQHKPEAFALIASAVDKEGGTLLAMNFGCGGARADSYDDPRVQGTLFSSNDKEMFAIYNKINASAGPYFYPANLRGQEAFQIYQQNLDPLWLGKAEPTDAFFDDVNKQLQAVLDKPIAGQG